MTKTKEQIRDEIKAGFEQDIADAQAASVVVAGTEVAEEAARRYLMTGTVEYPHSPADKKAQLGALLELAAENGEVAGRMSWYERKAMHQALEGEFSLKGDQAARTRRDGLKKGFETSRATRLREIGKRAAKAALEHQLKPFLLKQGLAVWDDYTDDQLYALSEIKLESISPATTDYQRFKDVMDGYFNYVDEG